MGEPIKDDFERLPYIHNLFNQLQKSLEQEAELVDQDTSREYLEAANTVDELHHVFTDLIEARKS